LSEISLQKNTFYVTSKKSSPQKSKSRLMIGQKMNKLEISDRLKMAESMRIEKASRGKVSMKISWFDVKGKRHYQSYSLNEGEQIEF